MTFANSPIATNLRDFFASRRITIGAGQAGNFVLFSAQSGPTLLIWLVILLLPLLLLVRRYRRIAAKS